jgi:hypothetical protein
MDDKDKIEAGRQRASEQYRRKCAAYRPPDLAEQNEAKERLKSYVLESLATTPIFERLKVADAVILERIAAGGGATNWYYCPDETQLEAVAALMRAGSRVSFYFDNRIAHAPYSDEIRSNILEIIPERARGPLAGALMEDRLRINMIIDIELAELEEYDWELASAPYVFYGQYPGSENDGVNAVTLVLPDEDGVVRAHPY